MSEALPESVAGRLNCCLGMGVERVVQLFAECLHVAPAEEARPGLPAKAQRAEEQGTQAVTGVMGVIELWYRHRPSCQKGSWFGVL